MVLATVFFFGLTLYISTTPWGSGRLAQTSIFSPLARVEGEQQEQIFNLGGGRILEARIFHNKVVGFGREYIRQYLSYFSPNVLFTDGGAESRYDIPNQGLLYITFLLLIAAAFVPVKTKLKTDNRLVLFFLYLLLLAPVPAAFTYYGAPNIHRSVFLVLMLIIPAAYGMYKLTVVRYSKIIVPVIMLMITVEFFYFFHQYSTQSDIFTALRRNDGQANLISYLEN